MIQDRKINLGSYSLFSTIKSVALIIMGAILFYMYLGEKQKRLRTENLIESQNSVIEKLKEKDGTYTSKIRTLETEKANSFTNMQTKDETIQQLQNIVKKNKSYFRGKKGSAGIIKSETKVEEVLKTRDSVDYKGNLTFTSKIHKEWYDAEIIAKRDSTRLKFNTRHELSIVIGTERKGFKRIPYAIANDKNPNSDIVDMRVYNVTQPKYRWSVVVGGGLDISGKPVGALVLGYTLYRF